MKLAALFSFLSAIVLCGCPSSLAPEGKRETACFDDCKAHAKDCDEDHCARGCRFILDRLVESEGHNVVACIDKANSCEDPAWADCAAKIGPHLDGGPPAYVPLPAPDEE
ncbi:MAG: hypothetical protein ABI551_06665 [Polyangiaceae bacterium]